MTIKWLTLVLVGFSVIMSPLAPADNLVDVYQLAETKDPELLGIIASHQATLEQYPQARARLLPSEAVKKLFAGGSPIDHEYAILAP